jgi:hypothetical protein
MVQQVESLREASLRGGRMHALLISELLVEKQVGTTKISGGFEATSI